MTETATIRVQGQPFRCHCGTNVFTVLARHADGTVDYVCNGCAEHYEGSP
jgi:predicted SprT family Zn-dependent metalloprotease